MSRHWMISNGRCSASCAGPWIWPRRSARRARKSEKESKDETVHREERFYGHFTTSFSLPEDVDEDGIKAESRDGMLTMHIPS